MAAEKQETCAYCVHHIWSDHQFFHICFIQDEYPQKKCEDTCDAEPKRFKARYTGGI